MPLGPRGCWREVAIPPVMNVLSDGYFHDKECIKVSLQLRGLAVPDQRGEGRGRAAAHVALLDL